MATALERAKEYCKSPQLDVLVRQLDYHNVDPRDISETSAKPLHIGVAPSFRNVPFSKMRDVVCDLPEDVRIMLTAALKSLPEGRTYKNVVTAFRNNPLLEPEGTEVIHADQILKSHHSFLNWELPGNESLGTIARDVETWYQDRLVKDTDASNALRLGIPPLAMIVAKTAELGEDLRKLILDAEQYQRPLLDLSGLLFPDEKNPYLKVFRLKLTLTATFDRKAGLQEDKNGLSGDFTTYKFKPNTTTIETLTLSNRDKALSQCESLFEA